jgi:hypothetical protein
MASPADRLRELFRPVHPPGTLENNLAPENFKGVIDPKEAEAVGSNVEVYTPPQCGRWQSQCLWF